MLVVVETMIRYLTDFGLLLIYLIIFWILIGTDSAGRVLLIMTGFLVGVFSVICVDLLYRFPLSLNVFAPVVEESCKFVSMFLFFSWNNLRKRLLRYKESLVWFGVLVGLFFAFLEDLSWIKTFDIGLDLVIKRGFISWPMHIAYTGCSTYGLVQTLIFNRRIYWLLLLPVSIFMHFLFNRFIAPLFLDPMWFTYVLHNFNFFTVSLFFWI